MKNNGWGALKFRRTLRSTSRITQINFHQTTETITESGPDLVAKPGGPTDRSLPNSQDIQMGEWLQSSSQSFANGPKIEGKEPCVV